MEDREARNSIFGQPANSPIQTVDKVKSELGIEVPVELISLPSLGKVYKDGSALHNREAIEIKAMTTREEDILTSRALIKKGTVITELLKSCLMDKTINVNDMISGDRNALMVAIRITGYGPEYEAELECTACNHKEKHEFRLDNLGIKRLEIEPVRPGENLFHFSLPSCKKTVAFKFLTGADEEDITQAQEKMKKMQMAKDNLVSTRLRYSIVEIEGKTDRSLINAFIEKMIARDSLSLRKYMEKNEPGIDMSQEVTCSACGHEERVMVPIGTQFFWPQS